MLQLALDVLEKCGVFGLFAATAIEASSLPFPGALFTLIYGYIMHPDPWKLLFLSLANSIVYTSFTMIPYGIGYKLEKFSRKRYDAQKIAKAQNWFKKYGEWSIVLSRPFSVGNYISYISGMSRIRPWRFVGFTFLGIFPWSTLLLYLGNKGGLATVQRVTELTQKFGYLLLIILLIVGLTWFLLRRQKKNEKRAE
jgi:membrane protein DedA with SNARE-associated domain